MMEIEQLWSEIDRLTSRLGCEEIALSGACGRTLAQEARSSADQPPFDQSAVDGYALAASGQSQPAHYRLVGQQPAGQGGGRPLNEGEAVRILTGAVVPEGAFAVVKQEDCRLSGDGNLVEPPANISQGAFIRRAGEVLKMGEPVLSPGTLITPGSIGLLAASGIGSLAVVRLPSVLHVITGDEIIVAGHPLKSGQIYDSNGPMIAALLEERGVAAGQIRQFWIKDSSAEIAAAIAGFDGDLLLISGGSGPGDRDHTLSVLKREGFTIHASQLNSRPGKPLIFATRGGQIAFGLPGNPLSHFVCYHAFVRRVLDRLQGLAPPPLIATRLAEPLLEMGDGRRTWLPGILESTSERHQVRALAWKHSGDLTPLARANALILLGAAPSYPSVASDQSARSGIPVEVLSLP
jgi:molybdopterin molybdotransferase